MGDIVEMNKVNRIDERYEEVLREYGRLIGHKIITMLANDDEFRNAISDEILKEAIAIDGSIEICLEEFVKTIGVLMDE